ncbi:heterokaryon incompatibility protein-domain-containing protein [Cercophora samala]|uniref:Heterokaryon incompatibility protein-domain-containing protein n=1 Tax=Cercophora samala TaxID=330535 RepID=A0AA39Z1I9_9PEZI|nr:heterokaryon incompatibility protein-domain-containing protein [Cercophora samala]
MVPKPVAAVFRRLGLPIPHCPECTELMNPPYYINTPPLNSLTPGCRGCCLIRHSLEALLSPEFIHRYQNGVGFGLLISRTNAPAHHVPAIEITLAPNESPLVAGNTARKRVLLDPLSAEGIRLASNWLYQCLASHPNCLKPSQNGTPFPKRLVDVGDGLSSPRLVLSTPGSTGQYVALSHSWGNYQPLKTEEATLADRLREIPISSMPLTFQHAAIVTRKLGFRYLWIDSLCIIQDSKSDWEEESAKMHDVYEGAVVTIAADAGPDSKSGLFCAEKRKLLRGVDIDGWEGSIASLAVSKRDTAPFNTPAHSPENPEEYFPDLAKRKPHSVSFGSILQSRGWVFQERVLSRRILHFGENEMAWECATGSDCECGTAPEAVIVSDTIMAFGGNIVKKIPLPGPSYSTVHNAEWYVEPGPDQPLEITRRWMSIVTSYARRELSFSSDKLVALSGLAAMVARSTSYTYLAGLWREGLEHSLLWTTTRLQARDAPPGLRHDEYHAPTWSWASLHRAAIYGGFDTDAELLVTIKSVSCTSRVAANPFGAVQDGRLVLECETVEAEVLDLSSQRKDCKRVVKVLGRQGDREETTYPDVDECAEMDPKATYIFIKFARRVVGPSRYTIRGLVARPSARVGGAYERVGVHEYTFRDGDDGHVMYSPQTIDLV